MKTKILLLLALLSWVVSPAQQIVQGVPGTTWNADPDSGGFVVTWDTTGNAPLDCYPYLQDRDVINQGQYNAAAYGVFDSRQGVLHAYIDKNQLSGVYCYVFEINPFTTVHTYRLWVHYRDGNYHYQDISVTFIPRVPQKVKKNPNHGHGNGR